MPGNRTWSNSFGSSGTAVQRWSAIQHTHEPCSKKYPNLESNQDQDFRKVSCCPLHHRDTRADDWICTSALPFSVEPRRHQARAQGVEPCPPGLEAGCSPRSTLAYSKGDRRESNPHFLLHRQTCRNRYTTDTMLTDTTRCQKFSGRSGS